MKLIAWFSGLSMWKVVLLVAGVCLSAGFYGGWTVHGWQIDAQKHAAEKQVMKQDAQHQNEANNLDKALSTRVNQTTDLTRTILGELDHAVVVTASCTPSQQAASVAPAAPRATPTRKTLWQRITHKPVLEPQRLEPIVAPVAVTVPLLPQPEPAPEAVPAAGSVVLTAGTVGLLNRALDPGAPDPAGWSDAEKSAPTSIDMRELSKKLTEVAGQYHELALRHDALVDWVSERQAEVQKIREQIF